MSDSLPVYEPQSGSHEPLQLWHVFVENRPKPANPPDNLQDIFRVGDLLFGSTLEGALGILDANLITRVVSAPSQRMAYLVLPSGGKQVANKYLCLMPHNDGNYYCSCRSFLEKNSRSTSLQLCKHLLALELMPLVGVTCTTMETLTDEEFGRVLVTQAAPPT